MNSLLADYAARLELGEPQHFENIEIVPLSQKSKGVLRYLLMKEALDAGLLKITEVDVQEVATSLKATNYSDLPVLLLDGEELAGARQDRVLNTTILLKPCSETAIPATCTEQCKGSYISDVFGDSDLVMSYHVKAGKNCSVSSSLGKAARCSSDQQAVWSDTRQMSGAGKCYSPSNAMRDLYELKKRELEQCLETFRVLPGQKGLLVAINGEIAGFDMLSQEPAYKQLHSNLVWSYADAALLRERHYHDRIRPGLAREYLQDVAAAEVQDCPSIGLGWGFRFNGDGSNGSMLIYDNNIIHATFFRKA